MKKLLISLCAAFCLFLLFVSDGSAQSPQSPQSPQKGDIDIKVGIGGPNWLGLFFNLLPDGEPQQNFIPLSGAVSYFVEENVSIGLMGTYVQSKSDLYNVNFQLTDSVQITGKAGVILNRFAVGVRPEYHFGKNEKLDPYVGGMLGLRVSRLSSNADLSAEVGDISEEEIINEVAEELLNLGLKKELKYPLVLPAAAVVAGINYYISPNVGLYGEVGFGGVLLASGGVAFRF